MPTTMPTILLASGSPRRRTLLEAAGLTVRTAPTTVDETPLPDETALALVERLAREKAGAATPREGEVVVAGDTVVVLDDAILGKPRDADDAAHMLLALSGRDHEVISGWCVRLGNTLRSGTETTGVRFRSLGHDEIIDYILTGEPLDKAGAYGIQERGGALVEAVEGSFENVVGLPLEPVLGAIRAITGADHPLPPVVAPPGDR